MASIFIKRIKDKVLPKSLYGRALTIIIVPILLMQLIIGVVFLDRPWTNLNRKLIISLGDEINMISKQIKDNRFDKSAVIEIVKENLNVDISLDKYSELKQIGENESLTFAWKPIEQEIIDNFSKNIDFDFNLVTLPEAKAFEINVELEENFIITFTFHHRRITSPTTRIFMLWLFGTSLLLMIVSIIFMKNQIKPIRKLAIAAEKLGKGQDVEYFKVEGALEVKQAARAFLEMRSRITRQIEQRTAMLAGVSHDIKTPITRIKLQLEMMENSPDIEFIKQDLHEMEVMLEAYLAFARGEGDEGSETVNIVNIVKHIISKSTREGKEIELISSDIEDINILLRPNAIERAIANIIGNACKYASKAWVKILKQKYAVEIIIEDNGAGIPDDKKMDVFKPFFRIEKSRNSKTGGIGLGLSVAQDIVNNHGGQIKLYDSEYGGLKVVIRLPL